MVRLTPILLRGEFRPDQVPIVRAEVLARNLPIRRPFDRRAMLRSNRADLLDPLVKERWGHVYLTSEVSLFDAFSGEVAFEIHNQIIALLVMMSIAPLVVALNSNAILPPMNAGNSKLEQWQLEDAARLKRLFEAREPKVSQAEFGSQFDIGSQGMVWQYLAGRRPLNLKAASAFARGLSVPLEQISPTLAKQASSFNLTAAVAQMPLLGVLALEAAGAPPTGRIPIKRYKEVRLSAGVREGFDGELDQRDGGQHYLPSRFIEKHNLNPNLLFAIEVEGESMEDTLYEGNLVVVNRADRLPVSGEIYAINVGDKATIKRLIKKGPMWHLSSDNPNKKAHPDVSMAEAQGEVIGKVVWREGGL